MVKVYKNKNIDTLQIVYKELYISQTFEEAVNRVQNLCYYNSNKKIGRKVAIELVLMYNNATGVFN
jgi:hypothetical protein